MKSHDYEEYFKLPESLTSDDEQFLSKIAHSPHILGYFEAILSFGYQI
jgi:hypothetical protein